MSIKRLMSANDAVKYIRDQTEIFQDTALLSASTLNSQSLSVNGLANNLILIKDRQSGEKFVLKQILPYVRQAAEENVHIPLPEQRIYAEYYSIKLLGELCPGFVPEIYLFDENNNIIIFEYISNMELLRSEFIRGKKFNHLSEKLADFLAAKAFFTSDIFLDDKDFNFLVKFFDRSKAVDVWDRFIFLGAVLDASDKSINPYLKEEIIEFRSDKTVRKKVEEIRELFKNKKQCLLHGDFHTSNIFVAKEDLKIFDTEFSMYGPSSYDMGRLLANIILNYASIITLKFETGNEDYQNYLLELIENIYSKFIERFYELTNKYSNYSDKYIDDYFKDYIYETVSFTAITMIMRIYEEGLCLDFKRIKNLRERSLGQRFIIELAEKLLYNNRNINDIKDFKKFIKDFNLKHEIKKVVEITVQLYQDKSKK